jgi:hypothetical protein
MHSRAGQDVEAKHGGGRRRAAGKDRRVPTCSYTYMISVIVARRPSPAFRLAARFVCYTAISQSVHECIVFDAYL